MSPSPCIRPQALRPGDTVAVLAPAGPPDQVPLRHGLAMLAGRYRLRLDATLGLRQGYLAGDDAQRTDALNRAMGDPDVRAILCARGGYGVTRILADLDASLLVADPKPIVGFSDVTALHAWACRQGIGSVHGPVVTQLPRLPPEDAAHLFDLLEHPEGEGCLTASVVLGDAPAVAGVLTGGNLSLMAALAGTPWALATVGHILLLEDVAEAPYRMDRMLTQLRFQNEGGPLSPVAVGIGALAGCRPDPHSTAGGQPSALAVLLERLSAPSRPMLSGLPFGHGDRNRAWPVGALAVADPSRGEIRWLPA